MKIFNVVLLVGLLLLFAQHTTAQVMSLKDRFVPYMEVGAKNNLQDKSVQYAYGPGLLYTISERLKLDTLTIKYFINPATRSVHSIQGGMATSEDNRYGIILPFHLSYQNEFQFPSQYALKSYLTYRYYPDFYDDMPLSFGGVGTDLIVYPTESSKIKIGVELSKLFNSTESYFGQAHISGTKRYGSISVELSYSRTFNYARIPHVVHWITSTTIYLHF